MTIWAKVVTQFRGFHCYPNAPEDVKFLRDVHRHVFHVTLWIEQFHDSRDLEYFQVQKWLDTMIDAANFKEAGSCEFMAIQIAQAARRDFTAAVLIDHIERVVQRAVKCQVLEDGENGAFVENFS